MHFFLVLVLFGGIAGSCHGVLSGEVSNVGAGLFYIRGVNPEDSIRGIRFFIGIAGLFKSVQIKINNEWSSKHGAPGGDFHEILLYEGESIINISGYKGLCIRSVTIETNMGRKLEFGQPVGQRFNASPSEFGMELNGISGVYGIMCLKKLEADWKYISEIPTETELATEAAEETTSLTPTTA